MIHSRPILSPHAQIVHRPDPLLYNPIFESGLHGRGLKRYLGRAEKDEDRSEAIDVTWSSRMIVRKLQAPLQAALLHWYALIYCLTCLLDVDHEQQLRRSPLGEELRPI